MADDRYAGYSDAAKACSDAVNLAVHAGGIGKWVAIRLSDGKSDGVLYDQRADAIEHQFHESLCCYIKVPPDGMQPDAAESFMAVNRKVYDGGFRLIDPDDERTPILPYRQEEVIAFLNSNRSN